MYPRFFVYFLCQPEHLIIHKKIKTVQHFVVFEVFTDTYFKFYIYVAICIISSLRSVIFFSCFIFYFHTLFLFLTQYIGILFSSRTIHIKWLKWLICVTNSVVALLNEVSKAFCSACKALLYLKLILFPLTGENECT